MVERFAVLLAFAVAYGALWWAEWELMREVREENRRKRAKEALMNDNNPHG